MKEYPRQGIVDEVVWRLSNVTMWMPAFIVVIMLYEVIMRYVFESATYWVNEMSLWTGGLLYLLAGMYAMQQRSHIRIFIIYDMMPRPWQKACDCLSTLLIVLFVCAVIWGGYGEAMTKLLRWERFGTVWDPPIPATMKPMALLVLVCISIQSISNLITDWHGDKTPHTPEDDIDIDDIEGKK